MREQIEGSQAVAWTVARCRPEVIAAYPISPQTHIVEGLSDLVRIGELRNCEYLMVESEFGALSACIGASAAGARAYTATSSQALLFMAEALFNASGLGLPIVMTVANRAIGAPINIWNDHSDAMAMRDSGWIQLYAGSNQEAADLHLQGTPSRCRRWTRSRGWQPSSASSSAASPAACCAATGSTKSPITK